MVILKEHKVSSANNKLAADGQLRIINFNLNQAQTSGSEPNPSTDSNDQTLVGLKVSGGSDDDERSSGISADSEIIALAMGSIEHEAEIEPELLDSNTTGAGSAGSANDSGFLFSLDLTGSRRSKAGWARMGDNGGGGKAALVRCNPGNKCGKCQNHDIEIYKKGE